MTRLRRLFVATVPLAVLAACDPVAGSGGGGSGKRDGGGDGGTGDGGGCVATTCLAAGKNCGAMSDGCGQTLQCGTCPSGETCGAGGTANVCGKGSCTPTSCTKEQKNCGDISDGCGAMLHCGSCGGGKTCGGGGVPNVCGGGGQDAGCTPTSCASEGKDCGDISDGCGGTLHCGSCKAPLTCGGSGVQNLCGGCLQSCPSPYACDTTGTCVSTNPSPLHLDVSLPTQVTVSGSVTVNGGAPPNVNCQSGYTPGTVYLTETTTGYAFSAQVSYPGYTWSALVDAGTYKVELQTSSYASNCDGGFRSRNFEVLKSQAIPTNTSGVKLDIPLPTQVTVSGSVTVNGGAPPNVNCQSGYTPGTVYLTETTTGYSFSAQVNYPGYTWSALVDAGTYKVELQTSSYASNCDGGFRSRNFEVLKSQAITTNTSGLKLNVALPTQVTVSGSVTVNGGAPPNVNCQSGYTPGTVYLTETTTGYSFSAQVNYPGYTWTTLVDSGTYKVELQTSSYASNCDGGFRSRNFEVLKSKAITTNTSGVKLDIPLPTQVTVSGSVTVNGGAPPNVNCQSGYTPGTVYLTETTTGYAFSAQVSYPGYTWSTLVDAGTYKVEVQTSSYASNCDGGFRSRNFEVLKSQAIPTNTSGLKLDIPLPTQVTVSGSVTVNGGAPPNVNCQSGYTPGTVYLTETTTGYSFSAQVSYPGYTWSALVDAGTYKVELQTSSYASNCDGGFRSRNFEVLKSKAITTNTSGVKLDVALPTQVTVSGSVTVNGGAPPNVNCQSGYTPGTVYLTEITTGYSFSAQVNYPGYTWSTQVDAGTYKVELQTSSYDSNCDGGFRSRNFEVLSRVRLP